MFKNPTGKFPHIVEAEASTIGPTEGDERLDFMCVSSAPLGWHSSVPADGQLMISSMGGSKSV